MNNRPPTDVHITDGEAMLISRLGKMIYGIVNIQKGILELDEWRVNWGYSEGDEVHQLLDKARKALKREMEDVINHRKVREGVDTPLPWEAKDEPNDLSY